MRFHRSPFRDNRPQRDEAQSEPGAGSREADYLRSLADEKRTIVVHLRSGEAYRGFIEYYDKRFVRLTRVGAPNLFIFKQDIKYLSEE